MVPREILVDLIEELIVENTRINEEFNIEQKKIDLDEANSRYREELDKADAF